ncbi:MAG: Ig-like domain-containing protein [Treponema sp.]|jgi:hypothetical protein|nr:Ig-like domain-containing protein [Treponema sp.]
MCRLKTKNAVLIAVQIALFSGCGFADLRVITVTTSLSGRNAVLPTDTTPVVITFGTAMRRVETEKAVQVASNSGSVDYDSYWQGNSLYCAPAPAWTRGVRYALNLSGAVFAEDGRELRIAEYIPFFAVFKDSSPFVASFSPENTASVGIDEASGAKIELCFSESMDRKSAETAFSLDGVSGKKFLWTNDDKTLAVTSDKPLAAWTVYHWSISVNAVSKNNIPLVKAVSAQFTTNAAREHPQVSRVFPMLRSNNKWLDSGGSLENGVGSGMGIGIEFSKRMDEESMLKSAHFEPSLPGRIERTGDSSIIFIPDNDPEIEARYTLIVSADTKDAEGLTMGRDYRACFIPDIPFLTLVSINSYNMPNHGPLAVQILPTGQNNTGSLFVSLRFSLSFTEEARLETAFRISFAGFFPDTLPPVHLKSVNWIGEDILSFEWDGLKAGSDEEEHYYKLTLPATKTGVNTGKGSYLQEELSFYFKVKP